MKVVFEGTVNGQKFDNIQDYNAAVQKVLAEGGELHTSSQTHTVQDDCVGCSKPECTCTTAMFPEFEHCQSIKGLDDRYLLTKESPIEFKQRVIDTLNSQIIPELNTMSYDALDVYREIIHNIANDHIAKTIDELADRVKEYCDENRHLKAQFEASNKRVKDNTHKLQIASALQDVYGDILDITESYMRDEAQKRDALAKKTLEDVNVPETQTEVKEEPKVYTQEDYINSIRKLVKTIFG